jgi:hypothetical protein
MTHPEVWVRQRITINTDPQRRCYDGCNFSERTEWGAWERVAPYATLEDARSAAATFKSINPKRQYEVRP